MPIRKPNHKAKSLRKSMPPAENRLWYFIRKKQLNNLRFRRQHSIGPYIADFACLEVKLVIELDGEQHGFDENIKKDKIREQFMETAGWCVLRFWNEEIYKNIDGVRETILIKAHELQLAKSGNHR